MKKSIFSLSLLLSFLLLGMLFSGCGKRAKSEEPVQVPVQVITPQALEARSSLTFSGVTSPQVVTAPAFQVPGKIVELRVKVGERVKQGQAIALLDPRIYQNQVQVSQANVQLAQANLAKVQAGARAQEIEMARQQMLQAQHGFELARNEKDRFESLYKIDAVPKRQYESVLTQYNLAKDQLASGQQRYELVKEGASREDKQIAGANVELALSSQASAATQLSYTRLFSPVDGVVAEKKAEVGMVVGAGTPIYEIRSTGPLDLVILVPNRQLEQIHLGQKAEVSFLETPDKIFPGVVREIKPASETPTGSYRVKIKILDSQPNHLYSGQIGKAFFAAEKSLPAASVPLSCLQKNGEQKIYYIYTVNAQMLAQKIPVQVLRIQDDRALIQGGFKPETQIVISGQDYLKEGAGVKIVEALGSQKTVSPDLEPTAIESGIRL